AHGGLPLADRGRRGARGRRGGRRLELDRPRGPGVPGRTVLLERPERLVVARIDPGRRKVAPAVAGGAAVLEIAVRSLERNGYGAIERIERVRPQASIGRCGRVEAGRARVRGVLC